MGTSISRRGLLLTCEVQHLGFLWQRVAHHGCTAKTYGDCSFPSNWSTKKWMRSFLKFCWWGFSSDSQSYLTGPCICKESFLAINTNVPYILLLLNFPHRHVRQTVKDCPATWDRGWWEFSCKLSVWKCLAIKWVALNLWYYFTIHFCFFHFLPVSMCYFILAQGYSSVGRSRSKQLPGGETSGFLCILHVNHPLHIKVCSLLASTHFQWC